MVRLDDYPPTGSDRIAQGSEHGHVLLLRSISKRGEDVAGDVETRRVQRQPEIMTHVTQPLWRQFPALAFRRRHQSLRLIHAKDIGSKQRKRAGEPAPATRRVKEAAPWLQIEHRPEIRGLLRISIFGEHLSP